MNTRSTQSPAVHAAQQATAAPPSTQSNQQDVQKDTLPERHWPLLELRSDSHSILHRWLPLNAGTLPIWASALVTWLPLLVMAKILEIPLLQPSGGVRLPFLRDWNVAFMFLFTLPMVTAMLLGDHALLIRALRTVQREETVNVEPSVATSLVARWNARFSLINTYGLTLALVSGVVVAMLNHRVYSPKSVGHWMAVGGEPTLAGWWFLACVAAFYTLTAFYVVRSLAIWRFLRELAQKCTVRPLPMHPDGSGGLRPIGEMGLRNQYLLTAFGINLCLLALTSETYLGYSIQLNALVGLAGVAYVIIGPVVFGAPLLPFRAAMLSTKMEVGSQVALRLRHELRRIREALPDGEIDKSDEEIVDRLRKMAVLVDDLPVWPFDTGTLKKFMAAYLTPAVAFLVGLQDFIKHSSKIVEWFGSLLPI